MSFELLPYDDLTFDDFLLPETPQPFLSGSKNKNPAIYIGLSKWTSKENQAKKSDPHPKPGTLPFYAKYFNAIELNATHHKTISKDEIKKWYNAVEGIQFKFCPKFHKDITHLGWIGLQKLGITKTFIDNLKEFKEKLGPSFIQVPEDQKLDRKDSLFEYVRALPKDFNVSIELNSNTWFANEERFEEILKELNKLNMGIVINDTPGRRDIFQLKLSNATAFIRFYCQGDNVLDEFRIEQWKRQLYSWYLQGLEECYFFLHIQNEDYEDEFAAFVKQELKF